MQRQKQELAGAHVRTENQKGMVMSIQSHLWVLLERRQGPDDLTLIKMQSKLSREINI